MRAEPVIKALQALMATHNGYKNAEGVVVRCAKAMKDKWHGLQHLINRWGRLCAAGLHAGSGARRAAAGAGSAAQGALGYGPERAVGSTRQWHRIHSASRQLLHPASTLARAHAWGRRAQRGPLAGASAHARRPW